jgi:hypothetical protein
MRFAAVLLVTLAALAQDAPEIRGIVTEADSTTPIPGVEITLTEFVRNAENFLERKAVATTITDAAGAFLLKPGHKGTFAVAANKNGYSDSSGRTLLLDANTPAQSIRMTLVRPTTLTGRLVDPEDKPVPKQRVYLDLVRAAVRSPGFLSVFTDADGVFNATNLQPGSYVVGIRPQAPLGQDIQAFTESAFESVDQDIESSYWPGGVPSAEQALPVTVAGGGIANVGTIVTRKAPYYRLRISLNGGCAPNEFWTLRLLTSAQPIGGGTDRYTPCREDALLAGIAPGSYTLAVSNGRKFDHWALAPFTITDKNTLVSLTFNDSPSLTGSLIAADGADLSKLGGATILIRPSAPLPAGSPNEESDAAGKFTFQRLPWKTQSISVRPLSPGTYVKEIRYNHQTLRTHEFDASAGAPMEIVLDSGAATLTGVLKKGDAASQGNVLLVAASETTPSPLVFPPFSFSALTGTDVRFTISNIPPGDYRVITRPPLLLENEKITISRGEQKYVELKLK